MGRGRKGQWAEAKRKKGQWAEAKRAIGPRQKGPMGRGKKGQWAEAKRANGPRQKGPMSHGMKCQQSTAQMTTKTELRATFNGTKGCQQFQGTIRTTVEGPSHSFQGPRHPIQGSKCLKSREQTKCGHANGQCKKANTPSRRSACAGITGTVLKHKFYIILDFQIILAKLRNSNLII
jgi:hypothetical protein